MKKIMENYGGVIFFFFFFILCLLMISARFNYLNTQKDINYMVYTAK